MTTLPNTPRMGVAVTGGVPARAWSHNERDDAYVGEIVRLSARRRIVIDRGGSQYIVQKRFDETSHGAVWRGVSYHATRDSLLHLCVTSQWLSDPSAAAVIAALPELARRYVVQIGRPVS